VNSIETIYDLCQELDRRHVTYDLKIIRPEGIMVSVAVPGERWELEFLEDGSIELERFRSEGVETRPDAPERLLRYFEDVTEL